MADNPLGKKTVYKSSYDPELLFPIERTAARSAAGIDASLFCGYDLWNCHELSWLNRKGKPEVARLRIRYPASSPKIVESKSLKLYLASFIMSRFDHADQVTETIRSDLQKKLDTTDVEVELLGREQIPTFHPIEPARLIDDLDIACDFYDVQPHLLQTIPTSQPCNELLFSNLLKTNCPITGQPDWATVRIEYQADQELCRKSLLAYLVSYREHGDYHEACCERIYADIFTALKPRNLSVQCFFTRRGGIDINPCRSNTPTAIFDPDARCWRQ